MNITAEQMESIVRVVLQRLRSEAPAPAGLITSPQNTPAQAVSQASQPVLPAEKSDLPGTFRLIERVITLELLNGKLSGAQTLLVHPKAIVTPAVMDELRRKNVRLQRQLPNLVQPQRIAPLLLLCGNQNLAQLSNRVCSQQAQVIVDNGSETSLAAIRGHLAAGGHGALWCSATPFASVAATFGDNVLRTIQLSQLQDLSLALSQARPNVIVCDQRAWSTAAINNLIRNWTRSLR